MPKKYSYAFTEQELMFGYERCIENVRGLLASAKMLNENVTTQQYALGLYMYAVEEYGKAIMLKNSITGNKKRYHILGWILGKGKPNQITETGIDAHSKKIMIGYNNLPEGCNVFFRGVKITKAFPTTKTIKIKKNKYGLESKVSIGKGTTGSYYDTTTGIFDYNLDLKTSCFYIDWDENNNSWKFDVVTQKADLDKNIKCLENALK